MSERAVLGIDAAWTASQPSGVALAAERTGRGELLAVAPCQVDFVATADATLTRSVRPKGSPVDARSLLEASAAHWGKRPDLVAVDMPLAHARRGGVRGVGITVREGRAAPHGDANSAIWIPRPFKFR